MSNLGALGAAVALALIGIGFAYRRINVDARSRNRVERIVLGVLFACSCLAILTTVGIVLSLVFESLRFFAQIPITEFLFGLQWSPQMAMRADQVGSSGAFGAIPVIAGTLLITVVAMVVAVPTGLMIAVYLSDYAGTQGAPYLQAAGGDPGRHPDRGLRLLRGPHHRPDPARPRRSRSASTSPRKAPWPPA